MFKIIGIILGLILIVTAISLLMAWPFMWIWNYSVVATITVVNPIENYWIAFWLMMFMSAFVVGSNSSVSS